MRHSFITKRLGLVVGFALTSGLASSANDPGREAPETSYLRDHYQAVVLGGYGQCWHTASGTVAEPAAKCDPPVASTPAVEADDRPARRDEVAPAVVAMAVSLPAVLAERVTLSADTLFDFDTATLRPAGRTSLDAFAEKVRSIDVETIMAVGHADRFGPARYNQRLSEARVRTVKDYLVGKGLDARRIHAEGRGETQPVTLRGSCQGSERAVVLACLQPDRRVDIDVVGSRPPR